MESARFFDESPCSEVVVNMIEDIKAHGSNCVIVGDGASYNKSKVTSEAAKNLTGKPLAIVPPYSPFLSCPEGVNRVIKCHYKQERLQQWMKNGRCNEYKTALKVVENLD